MATLGSALGTLMDPTSGVPLKKTAKRTGMNEMLLRMLLPAVAGLGLGMAVRKGIGPIEKAFRAKLGDPLEDLFSKAKESRHLFEYTGGRTPVIDDVDFGALASGHQLYQQGLRREAMRAIKEIPKPLLDGDTPHLLINYDDMDRAVERAKMIADREIEILPTMPEMQSTKADAFFDSAVPFTPRHGEYTTLDLMRPALGYDIKTIMNPAAQRAFAKKVTGSDSVPSIVKSLEGVAAHEGAHAFNNGGRWLDDGVRDRIRAARDLSEERMGEALVPDMYVTKPTETVSHIHQLRDMTRTPRGTGLLDTLKKLGRTPRANSVYRRLIDAYTPESLDMLLRTIPVAAGAAAIPATATYAYNHRES